MIDNSLRVTASNNYLMSSAAGAACLPPPTHGELVLDSGLSSLAWLEQPMSFSEMCHSGASSFIL
ncbi:hypothetical protein DYH09_21380 [bacterium CPR1]|jgi:hypothetical protein|nr:hypothetical protein [bacterium CPR1]